jgi:hypothetical protein
MARADDRKAARGPSLPRPLREVARLEVSDEIEPPRCRRGVLLRRSGRRCDQKSHYGADDRWCDPSSHKLRPSSRQRARRVRAGLARQYVTPSRRTARLLPPIAEPSPRSSQSSVNTGWNPHRLRLTPAPSKPQAPRARRAPGSTRARSSAGARARSSRSARDTSSCAGGRRLRFARPFGARRP